MIKQRVHYFHHFGPSYFYHIKAMSWIKADYFQWNLYVKTKKNKKTSMKLSRPSNALLGKWESVSFIFSFYPLHFTHYPNTAVAAYYVHQSLWSPKVIRIFIITKIHSKVIRLKIRLKSSKSTNYNWRCKSSSLQLEIGNFRNLWLYFSLSGSFLCTDHYSDFALTFLVILMVIQ